MDFYQLLITIHVIAAFVLVGPLVLTPRWLYLYHHKLGRTILRDLHVLTGLGGWSVLISGIAMLLFQNNGMLSYLWIQVSLALFLAIQLFDHFWADKHENELETNPHAPIISLKTWLIIKLGCYLFITVLMVLKPLVL